MEEEIGYADFFGSDNATVVLEDDEEVEEPTSTPLWKYVAVIGMKSCTVSIAVLQSLREFVSLVSPVNIIPSVNNSDPQAADVMVSLLLRSNQLWVTFFIYEKMYVSPWEKGTDLHHQKLKVQMVTIHCKSFWKKVSNTQLDLNVPVLYSQQCLHEQEYERHVF
ncbi:uncharacterized protein LOC110007660 isoform X1 [Amborella trichopoda]|uniref:uncharacterized protein LOC110007660 isoform X1 n=1 Tax=Amborella trichopoda TaxID=13333 RepID=UPI0009C0136E|nr:uncharacterized protein LOC110007660 isoform X1 [Amborella trichopoda]XP_020525749.1 uncharacterized protein LOC110007660 isoform X1 [Amborella trichopoda]|eukprot:XP_020525748.1 uncharacterized protein LOC110007660 isoform X1 [Amborella trichopoda]